MWIGQGLLVFLVKCVCSVMFSNWIQWPNSEVHAFLIGSESWLFCRQLKHQTTATCLASQRK